MTVVRVVSRPSKLALAQTNLALDRLRHAAPAIEWQIFPIRSEGDVRADEPLRGFGDKAVFVTAIEEALVDGRADIAVHSLKDLPLTTVGGLWVAAYLEREDPRDVIVSRDEKPLTGIAPGNTIGTSSLRRTGQLREARPDVAFSDIRGNVDTRLAKLDAGDYDAVILAGAGLKRLGLAGRITEWLDPDLCTPAPGQGIIALQCRENYELGEELAAAGNRDAADEARAERLIAARVGATCTTAFGALARAGDREIEITAWLAAPSGSTRVTERGPRSRWQDIAERIAVRLIEPSAT